MLLFTPDRQLIPDDPIYEREESYCRSCYESYYVDELFLDYIRENPICKSCIGSSKQNDLDHCEPGEEKGIEEYYDKILNDKK